MSVMVMTSVLVVVLMVAVLTIVSCEQSSPAAVTRVVMSVDAKSDERSRADEDENENENKGQDVCESLLNELSP